MAKFLGARKWHARDVDKDARPSSASPEQFVIFREFG